MGHSLEGLTMTLTGVLLLQNVLAVGMAIPSGPGHGLLYFRDQKYDRDFPSLTTPIRTPERRCHENFGHWHVQGNSSEGSLLHRIRRRMPLPEGRAAPTAAVVSESS